MISAPPAGSSFRGFLLITVITVFGHRPPPHRDWDMGGAQGGETALHRAVANDQAVMARLLADKGGPELLALEDGVRHATRRPTRIPCISSRRAVGPCPSARAFASPPVVRFDRSAPSRNGCATDARFHPPTHPPTPVQTIADTWRHRTLNLDAGVQLGFASKPAHIRTRLHIPRS